MTQTLRAPIHLFDYLALEEKNEVRHEYLGGEVHAMVGGTMRHNRIAINITARLSERLRGSPCQVFMSDMRLHVQAADSVYYPDVVVFCGSPLASNANVLHDATLVVEVLSASTAEIDRREKLVAYRKLSGLRAYWIVNQEEQRVEVHERDGTGQQRATAYGKGEAIPAAWLGGEAIALARLYAGTDIA